MNSEERKNILKQRSKLWRQSYTLNGPTIQRSEKVCKACGLTKPIDDYPISRDRADGHGSKCKPCNVAQIAAWRKRNPEKSRAQSYAQYLKDKEKPAEQRLKYSRKYFAGHKEVMYERSAEWRKNNKPHTAKYMRAYHRKRMAIDPDYAFARKIKSKMRLLLKGKRKSASTEQLLGCKIADLRKWLELHWKPGMSWENYGLRGWHIDHIRPVASFDFSKPEDQKACFHYTNLQPLWWRENIQKGDSYQPA